MPSTDGKPIVAGISGFSHITTGNTVLNKHLPVPIYHPEDLLKMINQIREVINLEEIEYALSQLRKHIRDLDNPHHTDLPQFDTDICEFLYKKYIEAGGSGSYTFYLNNLFHLLYVADLETIKAGTDLKALISVRGARWFFRWHDADPDAHYPLFAKLFPGTAVVEDPSYSLYGRFSVSSLIQTRHADNATPYTFIGNDGYLHTSDRFLSVEYIRGEPMIPCWETRTNSFPNSNNFDRFNPLNVTVAKNSTIVAPDKTRGATEVVLLGDTFKTYHKLMLPNISIAKDKSMSFSIFVKAGTCRYMNIQYNDTVVGPLMRGIYDLENGSAIIINGMARAHLAIYPMANGWNRCCFTWTAKVDQTDNLELLFFQDKTDNEVFQAQAGTAAYLWGMQFEEGSGASPYIPTTIGAITREAIPVCIDVRDWWTPDAHTISMTCLSPHSGDSTRPLYVLENDGETVESAVFQKDGKLLTSMIRPIEGNSPDLVVYEHYEPASVPGIYALTHGVNAAMTVTASHAMDPTEGITGAAWTGEATHLNIGNDGKGNFLNGYVRHLVVYPIKCSVGNAIFLNGEQINE